MSSGHAGSAAVKNASVGLKSAYPFTPVEHPQLNMTLFLLVAAEEVVLNQDPIAAARLKEGSADTLQGSSLNDKMRASTHEAIGAAPSPYGEFVRALGPGVGEIFAHRLAKHIGGVNVPEVRLTEDPLPERNLWFSKPIFGGVANSRRVSGSLPIYFLDQQFTLPPRLTSAQMKIDLMKIVTAAAGIEKAFRDLELTGYGVPSPGEYRSISLDQPSEVHSFHESLMLPLRRRLQIARLMNKRCPLSRSYYSDFREDWERNPRVMDAATWNGSRRLLVHAFRSFLHTTFGHASNTLVDSDGRLFSLDFEKTVYTKGSADIEQLGEIGAVSEKVAAACRQISKLTAENITVALTGIPERFWQGGFLDNPSAATDYFSTRLNAWKAAFGH